MQIWLVRHGTTVANEEGRIQGRQEFPLSSSGREEAAALARRLQDKQFFAFFSSNLLRARETARIISAVRKGPAPVYSPLLQEYCWGIIQGHTGKEIAKLYPLLDSQLQQDFYRTKIPGAEGLNHLFRRAGLFYRFLLRLEQRGKMTLPVLLVSHGRFLQAFVLYCLDYNPRGIWPFSFSPASLTILEVNSRGKARLRLFNDTCHLQK